MREALFGRLQTVRNNVLFREHLREQAERAAAIEQTQFSAKQAALDACNTECRFPKIYYPKES